MIKDMWPDLCGQLLEFSKKNNRHPTALEMSRDTFMDFAYHSDPPGCGMRQFEPSVAPGRPTILGFRVRFDQALPRGETRLLGEFPKPSDKDDLGRSDGFPVSG